MFNLPSGIKCQQVNVTNGGRIKLNESISQSEPIAKHDKITPPSTTVYCLDCRNVIVHHQEHYIFRTGFRLIDGLVIPLAICQDVQNRIHAER